MLKFAAKYPFQRQLDSMDCGAACLKMISQYHGISTELSTLRDLCNTSRLGTNVGDLIHAAEKTGFNAAVFKTTLEYLKAEEPFPCIVHWRKNHYVVLFRVKNGNYTIADPGHGLITIPEKEFKIGWQGAEEKGIAIFIEVRSATDNGDVHVESKRNGVSWQAMRFISPHSRKIGLLFAIILAASLLSMVIPRTIQYMTDKGIGEKNVNIIWMVLLFQFVLFGGITLANYLRSLLQAKLSTQLSIDIISVFLKKLLRLPISFFDSKTHADVYQRIDDHSRIEVFLSTRMVSFVFSIILLTLYLLQLYLFDIYVSIAFLAFTVLAFFWFFKFMEKRRKLDYRRFGLAVRERHYMNDLIAGMTEIKLNSAQDSRVSAWKELQTNLYDFKLKSLKLSQAQQNGINTINQLKSIFITFLCSYWVINDKITFGEMLGIGYIVGQLTLPLQEMMDFFRDKQDAVTSFNRLNEIQLKVDENAEGKHQFPVDFSRGFRIADLSFKYPGIQNADVLQRINLFIPKGKITAIVGVSGSGKTTLMKLLLGFYQPQTGYIAVDDFNMNDIDMDSLRARGGVVVQDGYIYNSSIAQNIAMSEHDFDIDRVRYSLKISCLDGFVDSLPQNYNTMLGSTGVDLSGGQKQRLFIARAIYRDPEIIFFDEATNSLDSNNELAIMTNLEQFFRGKTVLVIAGYCGAS